MTEQDQRAESRALGRQLAIAAISRVVDRIAWARSPIQPVLEALSNAALYGLVDTSEETRKDYDQLITMEWETAAAAAGHETEMSDDAAAGAAALLPFWQRFAWQLRYTVLPASELRSAVGDVAGRTPRSKVLRRHQVEQTLTAPVASAVARFEASP